MDKLSDMDLKTPRDLHSILCRSTATGFAEFFKDTEVGSSANSQGSSNQTNDFRTIMSNNLNFLSTLQTSKEPFSIKEWIRDESNDDSWLFLTLHPDHEVTLRPMLTTLFDLAITGIRGLSEDRQRRIWLIMDELAALNKLDSLKKGVETLRSSGGCFVLGLQSFESLEKEYSRAEISSILANCSTKLFLKMSPRKCSVR